MTNLCIEHAYRAATAREKSPSGYIDVGDAIELDKKSNTYTERELGTTVSLPITRLEYRPKGAICKLALESSSCALEQVVGLSYRQPFILKPQRKIK